MLTFPINVKTYHKLMLFDDKRCLPAEGFSLGHEGHGPLPGSLATNGMEIETVPADHTLSVCRSPAAHQQLYNPETKHFSPDIMI